MCPKQETPPCALVSTVRLQAHNHWDLRQVDEELKCKHVHQDKLRIQYKNCQNFDMIKY